MSIFVVEGISNEIKFITVRKNDRAWSAHIFSYPSHTVGGINGDYCIIPSIQMQQECGLLSIFHMVKCKDFVEAIDKWMNELNDGEGLTLVSITINEKKYTVMKGYQTVEVLKKLAGIHLADDLVQVIQEIGAKGKLYPLRDDSIVRVDEGDTFVSHPKDGGSI